MRDYTRYSDQSEAYTGKKITEIKQELASKRGALTHIKREIDKRSPTITDYEQDSPIFESNKRQIEKLATERAQRSRKTHYAGFCS